MKIQLRDNLPFVVVSIAYHGQILELERVLLDTGSAGSVFSVDRLLEINLTFAPDDKVFSIRGVGGRESVFTKQVNSLSLGSLMIEAFEIEVGAMDYRFEIEGILGMDFLTSVGAVIDLSRMQVLEAG